MSKYLLETTTFSHLMQMVFSHFRVEPCSSASIRQIQRQQFAERGIVR